MIDFSRAGRVNEDFSQSFILSKIDDGTIFYHYFGPFDIKKKIYKSVFSKDRHPSTGFYVSDKGVLKYRDFRDGKTWNCFAFVAEKYNISYVQALKKVAEDFGLIKSDKPITVKPETLIEGAKIDRESKEKTIIQIVPDRWTDKYLAFWRTYDVSKKELIENEVYPIRELFINKKKIYGEQLRFAYRIIHEGEEYMKIYSPYDEYMKWVSNTPLSIPFGLSTLPHASSKIIITKSCKDLIVLKKIFTDVIATQNESESALTQELQAQLIEQYEDRIIFWDNDETGVESCKKFNDKGFGYFNIPKEYYDKYKIKDASDFIAYFGVDALKELFSMKQLL